MFEDIQLFTGETRSFAKWMRNGLDMGINFCRARDVMVDGRADQSRLNVVLRFDIDSMYRSVAEMMCDYHESLGIYGSYYIIVDSENYPYYERYKRFFLSLQDRGHEIGLHVNSVEVRHNPSWFGRGKKDAMNRLVGDIWRIRDDGFDVKTMCAHGILWEYTNKDLLTDYQGDDPAVFNKFFDNEACVLADSACRVHKSKDVDLTTGHYIGGLEGQIKYVVIHPQSYTDNLMYMYHGMMDINELQKDLLCQYV